MKPPLFIEFSGKNLHPTDHVKKTGPLVAFGQQEERTASQADLVRVVGQVSTHGVRVGEGVWTGQVEGRLDPLPAPLRSVHEPIPAMVGEHLVTEWRQRRL